MEERLIVITKTELEALLRKVITEGQQLFKPEPPKPPDEWLNQKTICKMLSISEPTARKYRRDGHLLSYRLGSKIMFKRSEIDAAMLNIRYLKHSRKGI